ncbi:MAG: helix-turn-helix domain-containing protein [Treponema sp.]|jgi:transcriptional regulator with XRE-family HTH domain|nr:helix-turn-helix domain-containing protein [Treponema sp.]
MDAINGRVKEVRTALGISQRQFAKRIFISQSFYGDLELGKQEVNDRIAHLISSRFNVNIEWLKFGIGETFSCPPPNIKLERLIEIFNNLDDQLQDYLLLQSEVLLKIQREKIDKKN